MYAEIQAVVGFLSNFLYNKLPRRKVNLFSEQIANFLAQRFAVCWYPMEPQRNANMRCIRVNVDSQIDPLFSVSASCVGLELEEVTKHLPTELTIWVNPGEVSYRVGQCGTLMVLYSARDTNNVLMSGLLSPPGVGPETTATDATGPLCLVKPEQHQFLAVAAGAAIGKQAAVGTSTMGISNSTVQQFQMAAAAIGGVVYRRNSATGAMFDAAPGGAVDATAAVNSAASPAFELMTPNELKFTVGSFALTRFGTTKLKSSPTASDRVKSPKRRQRNGSDRQHSGTDRHGKGANRAHITSERVGKGGDHRQQMGSDRFNKQHK